MRAGQYFRPQIQIWKALGSRSFWSSGHSYWRVVDKNVVVYVINSYLVRLDTPYPDPRSLVGFWSLSCAFWQKLFNTKVGEHPQLSGNGSPVWTPNPNLEGPGPMSFWSCGPHHRERVCTFTKLLFGGEWALLKTTGPMQFFEFYQRWVLQFGNLALALRSCLHSTGEIFAKGWLKKGYCFYAIVMDCFSWVTFDLLQILFRLEPRGPNLSIIP